MQQTLVEGVRMWSVWQPDRNLFFNSFFIETAGGNLAVDPLVLDEAGIAEIAAAGGLAWLVVTNRDHERQARSLAARFEAKLAASALDAPLLAGPVDRALEPGEEILGARVIGFEGLKTPGEIALHLGARKAVVIGDALWGDPAGTLRLMPDAKLQDPARAALSLRRVAALRPEHLLVGDGACIFGGATRVLWACLEARADAYVNRINAGELEWQSDPAGPGRYGGCSWADLDFAIGAERLGYRLVRMPAGSDFCPLHWHSAEEELFVVMRGAPTLVTPRGTLQLRAGDYVAFPARPSGAHKLLNDGPDLAEVLMVANNDPDDVCAYPDSHKLLIEKRGLIVRDHPELAYYDGE